MDSELFVASLQNQLLAALIQGKDLDYVTQNKEQLLDISKNLAREVVNNISQNA